MKKRISTLVLSVILLAGALSACSDNGSSTSTDSNTSTSESVTDSIGDGDVSTKTTLADDGSWQPTGDYSEKVKFTMAAVQTVEGHDYTAGDDFAKYYSEKFNFEIEITTLTFDNWSENLRIWITSGDMPDVCVYNYAVGAHADAVGFVDQNLIKRLPDDWKERWPNMGTVFEATTLGPQMETVFNGTYFLPRARFVRNLPGDPLPNHLAIYLRADWAEAVGFPLKETYKISELIEYGKLIKEEDPGNIGQNLIPISVGPRWGTDLFVGSNSTHYNNFYKDESGEYQWGAASQDTLEGLKLFQEAYQSGVISEEFYTLKNQEDYDLFRTAGVAGGMFGEGTTSILNQNFYQYFEPNVGLDPEENIVVATILGEDGYYHQEDLINFWGTLIFNPDIDDVKFERYLDMIDFNATEEGFLIQRMGFEGVDYERNTSGELVSLLAPDQTIGGASGRYPSNTGYAYGGTILADDFAPMNPNLSKYVRDLSTRLYAERSGTATSNTFSAVDWTVYCYDSPSMRRAIFDYNVEYPNLVTAPGDLETNWKDWVDSNMALVQPVLDELNALG